MDEMKDLESWTYEGRGTGPWSPYLKRGDEECEYWRNDDNSVIVTIYPMRDIWYVSAYLLDLNEIGKRVIKFVGYNELSGREFESKEKARERAIEWMKNNPDRTST